MEGFDNRHRLRRPILYIFSGLPGAGKSTIAMALARHTSSTYLRIDTVEQGIRDLFGVGIQYEGYQLVHRIAAENLWLGKDVVADSCNPLNLTRQDWELVATRSNAEFINIEIVCSDRSEHKRRVESRDSPVPGLQLPTWRQVQERKYENWTREPITIDTAGITPEQAFAKLLGLVQSSGALGKR